MSDSTNQHWDTIYTHVVSNLPQAINARRDLLASASAVIPKSHSRRPMLLALLHGLNDHLVYEREAQLSLPLTSSKPTK